jgi:predicted dehydrogenase
VTTPIIGVACVGAGNWGKNQLRAFAGLTEARLRYVVDAAPAVLGRVRSLYPSAKATTDLRDALADPGVDAVVVASPPATHHAAAKAALLADKDVLIEKPMVLDPAEGEELVEIARGRGRLIQVGHLLMFHPVVRYLKDMILRGELGTLHYLYTQRLNLGTVRKDENALWSLAPHDVSLANFFFDAEPLSVHARGGCFLQNHVEDVVFLHAEYPGNRFAHCHVSWLDPHKVRRATLVGSRKMAVFDDMESAEKLRIHDKGFSREGYETFLESLSVRNGDIVIPSIPLAEPLRLQAEHFVSCVIERRQPLVGGREGLSVVRTLHAASALLRQERSRPAASGGASP